MDLKFIVSGINDEILININTNNYSKLQITTIINSCISNFTKYFKESLGITLSNLYIFLEVKLKRQNFILWILLL